MIAGAIISGAYFGDKISPLSDTTNLAPAMAGTDLFTHIRYMALTTVPITADQPGPFPVSRFPLQRFACAARHRPGAGTPFGHLQHTRRPVHRAGTGGDHDREKVPAIPALLAGSLLGGLFALIFQPRSSMRYPVSATMPSNPAMWP
jgi:Na+:H+ antiporter, NhaC family